MYDIQVHSLPIFVAYVILAGVGNYLIVTSHGAESGIYASKNWVPHQGGYPDTLTRSSRVRRSLGWDEVPLFDVADIRAFNRYSEIPSVLSPVRSNVYKLAAIAPIAGKIITAISVTLGFKALVESGRHTPKPSDTYLNFPNFGKLRDIKDSRRFLDEKDVEKLYSTEPLVDDRGTEDESDDVLKAIVWYRTDVNNTVLRDEEVHSCDIDWEVVPENNFNKPREECKAFYAANEDIKVCAPFAGIYNAWRFGLNQLDLKARDISRTATVFPKNLWDYIMSKGLIPTTIIYDAAVPSITVGTGNDKRHVTATMKMDDGQRLCFVQVLSNLMRSDNYFVIYDPKVPKSGTDDEAYYSINEDLASITKGEITLIPRHELRHSGLTVKAALRFRMTGPHRSFSDSPLAYHIYEPCANPDLSISTVATFMTRDKDKQSIDYLNAIDYLIKDSACMFIDYESSHKRRAITKMLYDIDDLYVHASTVSTNKIMTEFINLAERFVTYRNTDSDVKSRVEPFYTKVMKFLEDAALGFTNDGVVTQEIFDLTRTKSVPELVTIMQKLHIVMRRYKVNREVRLSLAYEEPPSSEVDDVRNALQFLLKQPHDVHN